MSDFVEQPGDAPDSNAAGNSAAADNPSADQLLDSEYLDPDSPEPPEEEEEEVEIGERKLALPKSVAEKLKTERMLHADYTQKTQSVAEERRQVAAEREQVQQHRQQAQEYLEQMADLRAVDKQLKELDKINLADYVDSDPAGVMRVQEQRRALEAQRAQLATDLTHKQREQALNEQQSIAKQVQDADAYFKREIPGWSVERSNRLQQYAIEIGVPPDQVTATVLKQPAVAKALHKAELYDALMKKQAPKPPPAAPAAKPAIRVGASATVKKDPSQMSDAEFAAHRRKVSQRR